MENKRIKKTEEQLDLEVSKKLAKSFALLADKMFGIYNSYQKGSLGDLSTDEIKFKRKCIESDLEVDSYIHDQYIRMSGMPNSDFYKYEMLAKNTLELMSRWENS